MVFMKAKGLFFAFLISFLGLVLAWPLILKNEVSLEWERIESNVKAVGRSSFHKSLFYSHAKSHMIVDLEIFKLLLNDGFKEIEKDGLEVKYYFETDFIQSDLSIDYYVRKEEAQRKIFQRLLVRKEY